MASENPIAEDPLGPYLADTERRIKRAWFPPRNYNKEDEIIVTLRLHNNGRISDVVLTKASANDDANDAAYKAIADATPFHPFLPGMPDSIDVELTFGSSVGYFLLTESAIAQREQQRRIENYLNLAVQDPVHSAFVPPKGVKSEEIIATMTIHRDGHPANVKLATKATNNDANNAVLRAIAKAAPFRPLPADFPESIDAKLLFKATDVLVNSLSETDKAFMHLTDVMEQMTKFSSRKEAGQQHYEGDR